MKIPKLVVKKVYELTYLLPAASTQTEVETIGTGIEALVKKNHGTVKEVVNWGSKPLAYRIRSGKTYHTEAIYIHQVIEFPTTATQTFENALKHQQQLLRYLMVVASTQKE